MVPPRGWSTGRGARAGSAPPEPRLRAASDRPSAVDRRLGGVGDRLHAARTRAHRLTGSPAKAGVAAFARLAPYALFALPAGVAVDRLNRKSLMIWADVVRVVALAALGLSIATGHVTFAQIVVVAFIEGTMFVVFNIAEIGAVRSVVPAPQLQRASGRR